MLNNRIKVFCWFELINTQLTKLPRAFAYVAQGDKTEGGAVLKILQQNWDGCRLLQGTGDMYVVVEYNTNLIISTSNNSTNRIYVIHTYSLKTQ